MLESENSCLVKVEVYPQNIQGHFKRHRLTLHITILFLIYILIFEKSANMHGKYQIVYGQINLNFIFLVNLGHFVRIFHQIYDFSRIRIVKIHAHFPQYGPLFDEAFPETF